MSRLIKYFGAIRAALAGVFNSELEKPNTLDEEAIRQLIRAEIAEIAEEKNDE